LIRKSHYHQLITLILVLRNVDPLDKIRIILLYIYNKGGITEENLSKLVSHAQIMEKDECIIRNMAKLNVPITMDAGRKKPPTINRKDRSASVKYQLSRFVPSIKDVMEVKETKKQEFIVNLVRY